jgi:hypothetical protein
MIIFDQYRDNQSISGRESFPLPTLNINTEFWPTENGECGEGPIDAAAVLNGFSMNQGTIVKLKRKADDA